MSEELTATEKVIIDILLFILSILARSVGFIVRVKAVTVTSYHERFGSLVFTFGMTHDSSKIVLFHSKRIRKINNIPVYVLKFMEIGGFNINRLLINNSGWPEDLKNRLLSKEENDV